MQRIRQALDCPWLSPQRRECRDVDVNVAAGDSWLHAVSVVVETGQVSRACPVLPRCGGRRRTPASTRRRPSLANRQPLRPGEMRIAAL